MVTVVARKVCETFSVGLVTIGVRRVRGDKLEYVIDAPEGTPINWGPLGRLNPNGSPRRSNLTLPLDPA